MFGRLGHRGAAANRTTERRTILAAKGGTLADITIGDVLRCFDAEPDVHAAGRRHFLFYRVLHAMGVFGDRGAGDAAGGAQDAGSAAPRS